MHFSTLGLAASFAATVLSLSTPSSHVLHEKCHAEPKKWVKLEPVAADARLPMRIGLAQSNIENGVGAQLLEEISHPAFPRYGQHLSGEEIVELFAPAVHAVDSVKAWLLSSGISGISQSSNKQWLQFDASTAEAEKLFRTKCHHYEHLHTGAKTVACEEYHLPAHLTQHVDYITPGLKLLAGGKVSSDVPSSARKAELEKRGFRTNAHTNSSGPVFGSQITAPLASLNKSAT
ncbi:hypothetical protein B0A48_17013 [Cryoendolithus antarcticus]|uniref:Peptidase S53 activation domain-containing protein n=1 Tax=Cryoendolithus antarcticus TaxID=1507870 RepID=A0A1V8SBY9_9PEZI|nr:hypothetical protein B0A48_17013 [Cryoendolithus antarcticus]